MHALKDANPVVNATSPSALDLDATLTQMASAGFIQFHPALADRLGHKAALFMGHALYWSRHLARTQPKRNGWFFMTARQWQEATGLTTREQTTVREQLVDQDLIAEMVAGRPAKLYYRVNMDRLAEWAGLHADQDGQPKFGWDAFAPWLRRAVTVYRPLISVTGSTAAALYLSYLLQAQRADARGLKGSDGYFPVSQEDVRNALCLGPKTQRNARDRLRRNGLMHERYGMARVDLDALAVALAQPLTSLERSGSSKKSRLVSIEAAPKASATRWMGTSSAASPMPVQGTLLTSESAPVVLAGVIRMLAPSRGLAQTRQDRQPVNSADSEGLTPSKCQPSALLSKLGPQVAVLSNPTCPFVETKLPFCRTYIQKESINTTTTTRAGAPEAEPSFDKRADSPSQGRRRISNDLVPHVGEVAALTEPTPAPEQVVASSLRWPTKLAAEWRSAIERTLLAAPEALRQALLDELEGQLGIAGKTIANPPGYVHGLIRRHAAGNLVLAMADQVATARAERERHLAARERALKAAPQGGHQAQAEVQPSISEAAQAERNKLRALRKQLLGGGGK